LNGRKEDTSSRDDGKIKKPQQDFFIESVIIQWYDIANPSSMLCVSTQVGCAQGCTFCATGKMGLMKRLTSDEILIQLYYAKKICRILNGKNDDSINLTSKEHETGDSNNNHKEGNEE
jgi:adenine C2-methylase RlmN of 23S rRNA A2503 and tRNA A37